MSRYIWATVLVVTVRALPAQQVQETTERLGDFYREASRDNPRIAASVARAQASEARIATTRRLPDPQLQLGVMNRTLPSFAPMPLLGMTQLQLMQMVPTAGKLSLAGRVASRQASAARARSEDVRWDVRTQVAMTFYDLVATDRALDVSRETLRLLQDVAKTTEAMYRAGEGRQSDVLRSHVEIARMAEDTLRMLAMRETMVARINALLNRDPATPVTRGRLPRFPDQVPTREWLDSLAVEQRPMVRGGREELRAAEANEILARRELFPDLQVGVQYGTQRGSSVDGMPTAGREHMASFMIGASLPIFARSRQLQMRTEAAAMRQMAAAELASMQSETRGRIGEALASLQRARRLSALYRSEILPQAEAVVASSLSAYRVGGVDFMTLLDNRMGVNRYRQELAVLESEQGKAWADIEMLIGRELFDPDVIAESASNSEVPRTIRTSGVGGIP